MPGVVEDNLPLWWRRSVPVLLLLLGLLQRGLQRIEPLLYRQQGASQFSYLPPLPHHYRVRVHGRFAAELLKVGLTLLARRGNLPFEFGNFLRRWRGRRCRGL